MVAAPLKSTQPSYLALISPNEKPTEEERRDANSRAVLVASVEDHEGVRFPKEVLFIQFIGTKLHGGVILQTEGGRGGGT